MPSTRLPASRHTANASGSRSSSVSLPPPPAPSSRRRNSAVISRRSASDFACIVGSSWLIRSTMGRIPLMTRAFLVPKIFLATKLSMGIGPRGGGPRTYCAAPPGASEDPVGAGASGRRGRIRPNHQLDDAGHEPGQRDDRGHDEHDNELIHEAEQHPEENRRVPAAEREEKRADAGLSLSGGRFAQLAAP